MSVGIFAMAFIVFAKQFIAAFPSMEPALGGVASIAWPWYVLIGTSLTFLAGMLSSFTHAAPMASDRASQGMRS